MKPLLAPLALLSLSLLGGCVIAVGGPYDEDGPHAHDHAREEQRNREAIAGLALGTPVDEVRGRLGEPAFSEALTVAGKELRVLRYRTHRTHQDGDTTRDETTPLIFEDGRLTGFGEAALAQALSR
ncbi:MAG TPA: DUF3192 domain-containing protein [Nevskiaceae bacterium]|nr:DUF3192 domain-containing protein [Nevskiaceae bacterium]